MAQENKLSYAVNCEYCDSIISPGDYCHNCRYEELKFDSYVRSDSPTGFNQEDL